MGIVNHFAGYSAKALEKLYLILERKEWRNMDLKFWGLSVSI